jgi:hypothetical protein
MNQPTNSNVNQTQSAETYQNQLLEYRQNHYETYQKLKKDSQVHARKEKNDIDSNRRWVDKGVEKGERLGEGINDQTYIDANREKGVEAYVDIGNVRLSHEIPSLGITDSFGRLTKRLHRFNPVQKRQEPQINMLMDTNPTPDSQSKISTFNLTIEKVAVAAVVCYSVYRIVREIGPPCWNFVASRLSVIASPETRFEVAEQESTPRSKSQRETSTFLQNKKKPLYKLPQQDTERKTSATVCIKCQLEFPSNLLSEKAIQENRAFVVATCNLPKYTLSAGLVGCVVSVDKANWMEVLFLPKEGPSCHFPWLEEAAQLWPFALLTNSVDDVKKSFDLKRAKESKDCQEYVFDIQKEWTGVTS